MLKVCSSFFFFETVTEEKTRHVNIFQVKVMNKCSGKTGGDYLLGSRPVLTAYRGEPGDYLREGVWCRSACGGSESTRGVKLI